MRVCGRFYSLVALSVGYGFAFDDRSDGMVRLVIGLNEDSASFRVQNKVHGTFQTSIKRAHAVAMTMPRSRINLLLNDTAVDYFYEDKLVYPMGKSAEKVGWGIPFIDADDTIIPPASPSQHNSDNCLKVCIVDGGLQTSHPDIPFNGPADPHVTGKTFNLPVGETWHDPLYHHGTHVAGILIASANNGIGIQGVVGDASNMCLLVARVFADDGSGQNDSVVLEAVEWCADNGANIINLSLGSPHSGTPAAKALYDRIIEDGTLVVSASGNSYSKEYNYPASWPDVLSVGAVDKAGKRAAFSNHNDRLNIAAPGVDIESTTPVSAIIDDLTESPYEMKVMKFSVLPQGMFPGELHECAEGATGFDFIGAQGKICIAHRGSVTFREKAEFCQTHGGIALIVVNNEEGTLAGTIGEEPGIDIPVVGTTQLNGAIVRTFKSVSLTAKAPGYSTRSGTSMAVPFVSGVAAKIWAARPECTATQVREAILASADKGSLDSVDPDDFKNSFGEGLVQAEGAYLALIQNPPPCGGPLKDDFERPPQEPLPPSEGNGHVETQSKPIYLNLDSQYWFRQENNSSVEVRPESRETPSSATGDFFDKPDAFGTPTTGFIDIVRTAQHPPVSNEEDEKDGEVLSWVFGDGSENESGVSDGGNTPNEPNSSTSSGDAQRHSDPWPSFGNSAPTTPVTTWGSGWRWISGGDRRYLRSPDIGELSRHVHR